MSDNTALSKESTAQFLRKQEEELSFFDGFSWRAIRSKTHLAQLEGALTIYLDKQLEDIEYKLALTMSKERGVVFEKYQKAITEISSKIRDQTIEYRVKSSKTVMDSLQKIMEDAADFDTKINQSPLPDDKKQKLIKTNNDIADTNHRHIAEELTNELEHYNIMCKNVYVGMTQEIENIRVINA